MSAYVDGVMYIRNLCAGDPYQGLNHVARAMFPTNPDAQMAFMKGAREELQRTKIYLAMDGTIERIDHPIP